MTNENINEEDLTPRERFAAQTAPISFLEIQKFFAQGMLVHVADDLDILDVAVAMHLDQAARIKQWMDQKQLVRAHDEHAQQWLAENSTLMAVTVAPWVLVQDMKKQ